MLLKIFVPLAFLILPVLVPVNWVGGRGTSFKNGQSGSQYNVTGLDQLAWGNVKPQNTHRYWAHLAMAVIVVFWTFAVFFDELRGYIRLRQAYMTSPQHRLRASATTVLVTAIPPEWLNVESPDNLFDVFPGGIRNIWINRNFDELNEKVKLRNKIALKLEAAETSLIKKCKESQLKQLKAEHKKNKSAQNNSKISSEDLEKKANDQRASQIALGAGVSSGNPHEAHTLNEALHRSAEGHERQGSEDSRKKVFDPALAAAGVVGLGVEKLGKTVLGGLKKVEGGLDNTLTRNGGYVYTIDDSLPPRRPTPPTPPMPSTYYSRPSVDASDTGYPPSIHITQTRESFENEKPTFEESRPQPKRQFWKSRGSKQFRRGLETDEHPLTAPETPAVDTDRSIPTKSLKKPSPEKEKGQKGHKEGDKADEERYPIAYNEKFDHQNYGEPLWKKYIRPKDRATWRLPLFKWSKWPSIWLIGKKVDTIDFCRKELARLNLEIEIDQQNPERFPLMNSAFIQFNHQVAAHMACQSVAHHLPKQMAPRIVEISPDDVIWDNMSLKWWERYIRTFGITIIVCAMVVGWAFPVAFTGLLSQLSYLEGAFKWLSWISKLPSWFVSAVQGVLPALFLAILMAILPLLLRFLSKKQGVHTGMAVELTVQNYYFAFLFVQLFLVVTVSSSFSAILDSTSDVSSWPNKLAENIPKSSNYFFSYMILQAMSVSAGALVQIFGLISWFVLAPIMDKTARKKWARTTNLNQMQWGTFFPVYTTLACIGMSNKNLAPACFSNFYLI